MKIQKGLVKYKDRNDIVCTYGITEDGRQLYFLNDSKLSNDNVIVTTTLVEAIDPSAVHSHVGVVNQDGIDVVPCVNKSIKLITKDLLLVEPADPISPNVKDANENKKDPVEAQKLVNASATIKDNIFKVMGNDGRFIFNDLFSEATLCDLDGNNLVDNKYYSFIAINKKGDTIYLSGNTKESNVDSFSLLTNKLNDSVVVNQDMNVPEVETAPVDVSDVAVNPESIDNAMVEEVVPPVPTEVEAPVTDIPAPAPVAEVPVEEAAPVQEAVPEDIPAPEPVEVATDPFDITAPAPIIPNEGELEIEANTPAPAEVPPVEEVIPPTEEAPVEELTSEEETPAEDIPVEENKDDGYDAFTVSSTPADVKRIDDNYNYGDSFDELLSGSNYSFNKRSDKDSNIMMEAANTISKLIDVNTNQKNELSDYKDQVKQLTTLNKKVVDKARRDLDRVKSTISSKDNEIDLLKSRIQDIESQLRDKERRLNNQEDELSVLRSQVEGRSDLQRVLADAGSYLDGE